MISETDPTIFQVRSSRARLFKLTFSFGSGFHPPEFAFGLFLGLFLELFFSLSAIPAKITQFKVSAKRQDKNY